jgi:Tol biopolymer transport system component
VFRLAALALLLSGSLASGSQAPTWSPSVGVVDTAPAWSADGRQIAFARYYLTAYEARETVLVLHVAAHPPWASRIPGFLFPTPTPLAWAPDSRRLAVGYNDVDVFTLFGEHVGQFAVRGYQLQFRWSPDGRWIAVISSDGSLNLVSTSDSAASVIARDAIQSMTQPGVVWTQDSARVGFLSTSGEFVLLPIDGSSRSVVGTLPPLQAGGFDVTLSPDGRSFAVGYAGGIWLATVGGSGLRRLTTGSEPTWSPDGKTLAFSRKSGVWKIGINGRGLRHLVTGSASQPTWSPRGGKIAYVGNGPHCRLVGIFWMNVDGKRRTRLTNGCG